MSDDSAWKLLPLDARYHLVNAYCSHPDNFIDMWGRFDLWGNELPAALKEEGLQEMLKAGTIMVGLLKKIGHLYGLTSDNAKEKVEETYKEYHPDTCWRVFSSWTCETRSKPNVCANQTGSNCWSGKDGW